MYGNRTAVIPPLPDIPPTRAAERISALSMLAIVAEADSYIVEGSGTVKSLPPWPRGTRVKLTFTGSPTFKNSTSLIVAGGADLKFLANESAEMISLGDGVWLCVPDQVNTTRIQQPYTATSWGNKVNRISDRLLVGAATVNDGQGYPYTDLDWFGALAHVSFNGGDGVGTGSDLNYAQLGVLTDDNSELAVAGGPPIGFLTAAEAKRNQGARAFEAFGINYATSGQNPTVWAMYVEAHHLAATTGNTYGLEMEVRNSVAAAIANPYHTPNGGVYGIQVSAGAGLSSTGQYNATAALLIGANPLKLSSGIVFLDGGIAADGPGSTKGAIQLPYDNQIQWFASDGVLGGSAYSDSFGNLHLKPGGGSVVFGGNLNIPDGDIIGWGSTAAYIGGSSASDFINLVTNSTEKLRVNAGGSLVQSNISPGSAVNIDGSGNTITVGASAALNITNGLLVVIDSTSGAGAVYLCQGGSVTAVSLGAGSIWVSPTTSPASGKLSVAWNGSSQSIYNNTAGSTTVRVWQLAL